MNVMPETPIYEVPPSRKCTGFRDGQNVDIVGVTGSIPVTPTIRINDLAENCVVPGRFNEPMTHIYRWDRQGRKGQPCRLTARGKMNSIRVVFPDGFTMITSGNSIRRIPRT